MGRMNRIIELCIGQAQSGFDQEEKRFHHGSVLMKGNTVLGLGHNHNFRTCVNGRICPSVHAEVDALISSTLRQCELHGCKV